MKKCVGFLVLFSSLIAQNASELRGYLQSISSVDSVSLFDGISLAEEVSYAEGAIGAEAASERSRKGSEDAELRLCRHPLTEGCHSSCSTELLCPSEGPNWVITPNAGPNVCNGADIYLTGEFTYWTIRQGHMAFAVKNNRTTNADSSSSSKGKVFHPDWNYRPGFKAGLGVFFDCDGWDFYANYTWQRVRNTKKTATESESNSLNLSDFGWVVVPNTTFLLQAWTLSAANWELDFNVADAELGRNFYISPCLKLRPHFGFKGTWQKQRMTVNTLGLPLAGAIDTYSGTGNYKIENWGIGIRAGLDSAWHFTPCLSFFAEVAASALWQHFDSCQQAFIENLITGLFSADAYFSDTINTVNPVLEFELGLRWENWFCCDEYHWSLEAGWEEQWWSDQNQFLTPYNETRGGALITQGLTVKLRFDF